MRIDAHQHFWDVDRFQYPWMPSGASPLRRNFLPQHLEPILKRNRFEGSVIVQANIILDETRWLLDLASAHEFIRGVVGWADLTDPRLGAALDEFQRHPKFKGVRHLVHDEPDVNWLHREDVLGGLRELARRHIPYDLLVRPQHLKLVPRLAEKAPDLFMVIDHIAKPPIAAQQMDGWAEDMAAAAKIPNVYCKLSGMITEADPRAWKAEHLRPYVTHVMQLFGPDRLMFGSDWPVCTLAGTWKEVLAAFTQAMGPQPIEARDKLLGGTAQKFYRLC
ncbi:MAG: amidohydrolase family protein [Acidobacteriia bacterium]|nr:amidohydrolase family protein [Terriglobia bacterium]